MLRLVIYDLDGTLYDDTRHFAFYAEQMSRGLPAQTREGFLRQYRQVLAGDHPLRPGLLYDPDSDWLLEGPVGHPKRAWTWGGEPVPQAEVKARFPDPIPPLGGTVVRTGDLWGVVRALARHHGLGRDVEQKAFLATRRMMQSPAYAMTPVPGMREAILALKAKGVRQVMATNSPEDDSRAILGKLGLEGLFDEVAFNANKPRKSEELFRRFMDEAGCTGQETLVVGDNYFNEVLPGLQAGAQVVYIDPAGAGPESLQHEAGASLHYVKSAEEAAALLRRLAE